MTSPLPSVHEFSGAVHSLAMLLESQVLVMLGTEIMPASAEARQAQECCRFLVIMQTYARIYM